MLTWGFVIQEQRGQVLRLTAGQRLHWNLTESQALATVLTHCRPTAHFRRRTPRASTQDPTGCPASPSVPW